MMKDIENSKKESPMLGLTGMGGGVASLMWAGAGETLYNLFGMGRQDYGNGGELGQNNRTNYSSPVQVPSGTNYEGWTYLMAGGHRYKNNAFAIRDGTLWGWGSANYGITGTNCQGPPSICDRGYSSPTQVGTDTTWAQSSNAQNHCIAVKTDGTMWNWGQGQLLAHPPGSPAGRHYSSPLQIGSGTDWAYESTGGFRVWGTRNWNLAIKQNGTLWGWGRSQANSPGYEGNNDSASEANNRDSRSSPLQIGTNTNWASVGHCDDTSMCALKTDNTGWVWGDNGSMCQLGLNQPEASGDRSSPTQLPGSWKVLAVSDFGSYGIKTDGSMWSWGNNYNGQQGQNDRSYRSSPTRIGTDSNWHDLAFGTAVCTGLKTDGTIWTWGDNDYGQLGFNDKVKRSSPTQVPGVVGGRTDLNYGNFITGDETTIYLSKQ
jgi:alpha-tubulin suppressor-like RCC1 family protein